MIKEKRTISPFIEKLLPQYIKDYYPNFCKFIIDYFKYLEKDNNVYDILVHIFNFIDVDKIDENYLNNLINEYLNDFPIEENYFSKEENKRFFIKNIKNFYKEKGNIYSAKFIFNILNQTIEIIFPYEKIFLLNSVDSVLNDKNSIIHDNHYYAYYVYEITTDLDLKKWKKLALSTFHPAGMKIFSRKKILFLNNDNILKYKNNIDCDTQNLDLYDKNKLKNLDYNILCEKINLEINLTNLKTNYFILNKKNSKLNINIGNKKHLYFIKGNNLLEGKKKIFNLINIYEYYIKNLNLCNNIIFKHFFDIYDLENITLNYFNNKKCILQKVANINIIKT